MTDGPTTARAQRRQAVADEQGALGRQDVQREANP